MQFIKKQLTFTGDDTAMATLLLSVMGALAEFDRALIKERQREGIALAKQRRRLPRSPQCPHRRPGRPAGRRSRRPAQAALARDQNISRETVYQDLRSTTPSTVVGRRVADGSGQGGSMPDAAGDDAVLESVDRTRGSSASAMA